MWLIKQLENSKRERNGESKRIIKETKINYNLSSALS